MIDGGSVYISTPSDLSQEHSLALSTLVEVIVKKIEIGEFI